MSNNGQNKLHSLAINTIIQKSSGANNDWKLITQLINKKATLLPKQS